MPFSSRVYLWFFIFLAVCGSLFVLPRLLVGNETGLAAGATAAVTALGIIAVALAIAITLLVMTLRHRASLSASARIAGFIPLPLLIVSVVVMIAFGIAKQHARQDAAPPSSPTLTTVPATP